MLKGEPDMNAILEQQEKNAASVAGAGVWCAYCVWCVCCVCVPLRLYVIIELRFN